MMRIACSRRGRCKRNVTSSYLQPAQVETGDDQASTGAAKLFPRVATQIRS